MICGNKIGVRVGDETIDVEEIWVVNAIDPHKGRNSGWRLHRPCGSPPMDFWDVQNAVSVLFRIGYNRDATGDDRGMVEALKIILLTL